MFKEKELDMNVFKVIISELLNMKKLSRNDVSNIIFKLLEQNLIEKDVANQTLEELNLLTKQ
jgi:signal recognition particle GTPase